MTTKYVTFDGAGVLEARLIKGVHAIPAHAIEVKEALWIKIITESDGIWTLGADKSITKKPLPAIVMGRSDIERSRLAAYSNPEIGSDRYFAEASRMQLMGEEGFEKVRDKAIKRFNEIQAQYPWPAN